VRPRRGPGGANGDGAGGAPVPEQDAAQVAANWPAERVDVRLSPYMLQAQQKWTVTPVADAGGYPGSPYFKITIAGTERALAATEDAELVVAPTFTGEPEQLWRIEQLADATYRVMPKRVPRSNEPLGLSAVGSSTPTLARFKPDSDRQRWLFKTP
jgi:arabinan endo-1,5-alpha-L-arabinosidase